MLIRNPVLENCFLMEWCNEYLTHLGTYATRYAEYMIPFLEDIYQLLLIDPLEQKNDGDVPVYNVLLLSKSSVDDLPDFKSISACVYH